MLRAFVKLLSGFVYLLTGGMVNLEKKLFQGNTTVIAAKYDSVISVKTKRQAELLAAIENLVTINAQKEQDVRRKTEEIAKLRQNQLGAKNKAQKLSEGLTKEAAEQNVEYVKARAAYTDYATTIAEKEKRCSEFEADVKARTEMVQKYKVEFQSLQRELDKIKSEKHESIADITAAKEAAAANKQLLGLSEDHSSETLRELREQRDRYKASVAVSADLAGLSAKLADEEYASYAEKDEAENEFDAAMGFAEKVENNQPELSEKAKLPE
jgi:DNA repair exonuclease SbcCD ATPase subunit